MYAWHRFAGDVGKVLPVGTAALCGWRVTADWLVAEPVAPTMKNTCPTCRLTG